MFRDMRMPEKALTKEECRELLTAENRGVLSVTGDDGYPYGVPMDHYYDPGEDIIYFHGGREGHKIDAIKREPKVSYCVYDRGYREDGDWAYHVKSVVVFGRAFFVEDYSRAMKVCRAICDKFPCSEEYIKGEFAKDAKNTLVFGIKIEHMTGKRIIES